MDFEALIEKVKNIPYGRNSNRTDFSLVISENKGTCSSKHAFLKDFFTATRFGVLRDLLCSLNKKHNL
jgi:hypothetical protein